MSDYQVTPSVLESNADRLTELNARFKGSISRLIEQYTERLRQIAARYKQTEVNTTNIASTRSY